MEANRLPAFQQALGRLCDTPWLDSFKLGTEEEGLGLDEITFLRGIIPARLGILVKIGGPCARADLRGARGLKAEAVVAPMVESTFALRRFLESVDAEMGATPVRCGVNIETGLAVANLAEMLLSPAAKRLTFMNIGRSDLAASLGLEVGAPAMHDIVCRVAAQVRAAGLPVHVGGQVTLATLAPVAARVHLDGFHTRFLAFAQPEPEHLARLIELGLRLEITLLQLLAEQFPARSAEHLARAEATARRFDPA